jgi:hypothetical protein
LIADTNHAPFEDASRIPRKLQLMGVVSNIRIRVTFTRDVSFQMSLVRHTGMAKLPSEVLARGTRTLIYAFDFLRIKDAHQSRSDAEENLFPPLQTVTLAGKRRRHGISWLNNVKFLPVNPRPTFFTRDGPLDRRCYLQSYELEESGLISVVQ